MHVFQRFKIEYDTPVVSEFSEDLKDTTFWFQRGEGHDDEQNAKNFQRGVNQKDWVSKTRLEWYSYQDGNVTRIGYGVVVRYEPLKHKLMSVESALNGTIGMEPRLAELMELAYLASHDVEAKKKRLGVRASA